MAIELLDARAFCPPSILLFGHVDEEMYKRFREQLDAAPASGVVTVELTTLGGDPEVARMMGADIRFHADVEPERRFVFLGKTAVYSAGATLMSFFPRENRYLTRDTRLMIHERKLIKDVHFEGPLTGCVPIAEAVLNELRTAIEIQNEGFANLVRGSAVTLEEVLRRAPSNWYIEADEAKALGLVEAVL